VVQVVEEGAAVGAIVAFALSLIAGGEDDEGPQRTGPEIHRRSIERAPQPAKATPQSPRSNPGLTLSRTTCTTSTAVAPREMPYEAEA
jgi:hypothetical protein